MGNAGCDMNLKNEEGNSALYCFFLTCSLPLHDRFKMAHLLIDAGCDLNAHNEHGNTALHVAAKCDYSCIVGRLIEKDADIHLKNKKNEKPLDVAFPENSPIVPPKI